MIKKKNKNKHIIDIGAKELRSLCWVTAYFPIIT